MRAERFLWTALGFYVLALAVGVLLRFAFVVPIPGLAFQNLLHAHSHTLYFGWAALALLTLGFQLIGAAPRLLLAAIAALSVASFVSFLEGGYSKPSIVLSALSLPLWFSATILFLRRARGDGRTEVAFLRAGVLYLSLSGVAALARVVVLVAKVSDPIWGKLAVFGFLHCFAMFFVFSVMGLSVAQWRRLGVAIDELSLQRQLRWMVPLAWATFPLSVPGAAHGAIGLLARVTALAILIPAVLWLRQAWSAQSQLRGASRFAAFAMGGWFALKSAMELGAALGLDRWASGERNLVILFLHVVLVGFVSGALLWLVLLRLERRATRVLALHHSGLSVMSLGLVMASAGRVGLSSFVVPGYWLAAVGGVVIFLGALSLLALPRPVLVSNERGVTA